MKVILSNQKQEVTKASLGLGNVDNTSDADKPISTATQEVLDAKADASTVSALQTTVAGKQNTITGGASTITSSNLTTNRALVSNSSGKVAVSAVTSTELGYLDGVSSNVQTQLSGKLSLTGGTMTGSLILASDPTSDLQAATKQYVDNSILPLQFESIWGDETATGDATWWANLRTWVQSASDEALEACLGKTKSVTLTTAVQDTTTHLVRCIGYNCDGSKTLTFQTKNCLASTTAFGSSNGYWIGSTVRTICQNYYSYFPGKASIKTVSKGTCASTNSSQSGTPTYNNETVFLPSDCEMGFLSGADYSNGKGYAASYDEYCSTNTSETSYQYYTSNSSRIKYLGDSGSSAQRYWERSLSYSDSANACRVRNDGQPGSTGYNYSGGVAPAFVIG